MREVGLAALGTALAAGAPVIDVRERDEYLQVRVPGVTLIPLSEFVARADEIPDAETVYVICAVGGRSSQAASYLTGRGINAVSVAGVLLMRSPFGRRNTLSRPSIRMRTSDLNRGVTMLTATSDSTRASRVGRMIQPRLRSSAWPSACRSRSPVAEAAGDIETEGAGIATARSTTASSSLPARQNAKRIANSRGRTRATRADYTPLWLPPG